MEDEVSSVSGSSTLKRRQDLFLDGIEVSSRAGLTAYQRLWAEIIAYSQSCEESSERVNTLRHLILLDAWSLVDVINRLRVLVDNTPGLKKNAPVKSFLNTTQEVIKLRNFVQHMESEVIEVAQTGFPIWGSLSWIWADIERPGKIAAILLIPGRLAVSAGHPIVNPAGKAINPPVDWVTLTAGGVSVNLSSVVVSLALFKDRYERALEHAIACAKSHVKVPLPIVLETGRDSTPPNKTPAPDG